MKRFKILRNQCIARNIYEITFENKGEYILNSGQFAMLYLNDPSMILGRPFSFSKINEKTFSFIYKIVGSGTKKLSQMKEGESLKLHLPLGQGFEIPKQKNAKVLIYAGGMGLAPLLSLKDVLIHQDIQFVLGFKTDNEVYGLKHIQRESYELFTDDGSLGKKGFVTTSTINPYDYDAVYACGPESMLKALSYRFDKHPFAQISLESRMGCGFGVCMSCVCSKKPNQRVCVEGPVFKIKEVKG